MIGRSVGLLIGIALVAVGCSGPLAVSARATITLSEQACIHVYVLYSTSCVQCRYVKPIVTRLIAEHLEGIDISLLSAGSAGGKDVRRRHGVRALPAVVAVGTNGKVVVAHDMGCWPCVLSLVRQHRWLDAQIPARALGTIANEL